MSPTKRAAEREAVENAALVEGVKAGDVRAISRVLTLVEQGDGRSRDLLRALQPSAQEATLIGITGYPGAGKSSLIAQLTTAYRQQGRKVGILAIDATSPLTGGALLGDRIRMHQHADDRKVFIRSVASRGHQGGLSPATANLAQVLAAAGYDTILIETVGVGQDEVAVAELARTVVAVVAPGLGDEVQAMKAGLLEVADIVVVNKGDHEAADAAMQALRDWVPRVVRTVATKGEGIPELVEAIAEHERERDLKGAGP